MCVWEEEALDKDCLGVWEGGVNVSKMSDSELTAA